MCDYIIHACGPRYLDGKRGEAELLALTHQSIIEVATENSLKSIVIPPISTGVYRSPVERAAKIAITSVTNALNESSQDLKVCFAVKNSEKYKAYLIELSNLER